MTPTRHENGVRGIRRGPRQLLHEPNRAVVVAIALLSATAATGATGATAAVPRRGLRAEPLAASMPTGLNIPEIGLHVRGIAHLGLTATGALQTPPLVHVNEVGWYRYGPTPGQRGAAVLAGHVDSVTQGAIFFRLHELHRGDTVSVTRSDRSTVTFTVDSVRQVSKAHFPTGSVYGDPGYPALRLITCGGRFDRSTGHYLSNIIVFARLTTVPVAPATARTATAGSHG